MGDFTGEEYHNHSKVPQDAFKPMPTNKTDLEEIDFSKRLRQIMKSYWMYDHHMSEEDSKEFWGKMEQQIIEAHEAALSTSQREAELKGYREGADAIIKEIEDFKPGPTNSKEQS